MKSMFVVNNKQHAEHGSVGSEEAVPVTDHARKQTKRERAAEKNRRGFGKTITNRLLQRVM